MKTNYKSELKQLFKERYTLLKKSCERYDLGEKEEIKTIAISLRIFFSNRGQKSLLSQISKEFNIKSKILSYKQPENPSGCLLHLDMGINCENGIANFVPRINLTDKNLRDMTIPSWWNSIIVITNGMSLSRGDLILGMTNKDGGAHVDPLDINSNYLKLTRNNLPIQVGSQETLEMGKFQDAVVRESGFYALNMIEKYFVDLL